MAPLRLPVLATLALLLAAAAVPAQTPTDPAGAPVDGKTRAAALVEQARPLAAVRDWKKVQPLADQAVKADPDSAQAHALLGLALHGQQRWAPALAELEKAAELGVPLKVVARAAAESAEQRKDQSRLVKWLLILAKEEQDQAAALQAARASSAPLEAYQLAEQLGPLPAKDLLPYARASAAAGAADKAAQLYDKALAATPDNIDTAVEVGRFHLANKDVGGGDKLLQWLTSGHPNDPRVSLYSADVAAAKGDVQGERQILEKLVATAPAFAPGHIRYGKWLQAHHEQEAARAQFASALAIATGTGEDSHRLLAEQALAAGDNATALKEAKAAQQAAPKDARANLVLGRAALASDDPALAAASFEAARGSLDGAGLLDLAEAYRRAKKPAQATAAVRDALKKKAPKARAHEMLGDIAASDGKSAQAIKEYALAAAGRGGDVPFQLKRAAAMEAAGKRASAAGVLDALLRVKPGDTQAILARARLYRADKKPEKAEQLLVLAVMSNSRDADLPAALAEVRLEQGNKVGARAAAEAALDIDAKNATANSVLGHLMFAEGKVTDALPYLELAAYAKGKFALFALADLYDSAGEKGIAQSIRERIKAGTEPAVPARGQAVAAVTPPPAPLPAAPLPAATPAPAAASPAVQPSVAVVAKPAEKPALAQADRSPSPPAASGNPPAFDTRRAGGASGNEMLSASYYARLVVPRHGSRVSRQYATTMSLGNGALYTHGIALAKQLDEFRHGVYVGLGTEVGGPTDTLDRYEFSYQFLWSPLGPQALISPHVGGRVGGMGVTDELLTNGTMKLGLVFAPTLGLDLQLRNFVLTLAADYDLNLGPDLGPDASVSGFALDLGATVRY
jgi:Tfp pilus assembly protein PilF